MSKTRVENEAPAHKYFTQMLNIAEDDLDPFQYRLLAHYVRWTGHGGESDESIRQAASATKMGVNKIRSTLQELENLKYIKVDRPTPQEARNGKTIHITILDRWMDNISRYQGVSEKTHTPVSKKIQDNPKPVSNQIHPPVSKKIRLKERGNKKQKEQPRKRLPFPVKFPSNINAYTAVHIEAYHKEYAETIDALVAAWHTDKMFKSITEMPLVDARKFIQPHKEILRFNISITEYPALIKVARKEGAWRDNGATPADIQSAITPYLKTSKKPIYDDPAMDLNIPQATTPILLQRKEEVKS